jgi:hypothetical protein
MAKLCPVSSALAMETAGGRDAQRRQANQTPSTKAANSERSGASTVAFPSRSASSSTDSGGPFASSSAAFPEEDSQSRPNLSSARRPPSSPRFRGHPCNPPTLAVASAFETPGF